MIWFAVESLLCALAWNTEALIGFRLLQGVGGALLTPGSLAIIGPLLGGLLVEISWRWVFVINVPVAVAVVVLSRWVLETSDPDARRAPMDFTGAGCRPWLFDNRADPGFGGLTLGAYRGVFPGRHAESARHETGETGQHQGIATATSALDSGDQAGVADESIHDSGHGRSKPPGGVLIRVRVGDVGSRQRRRRSIVQSSRCDAPQASARGGNGGARNAINVSPTEPALEIRSSSSGRM